MPTFTLISFLHTRSKNFSLFRKKEKNTGAHIVLDEEEYVTKWEGVTE